MIVRKIALNGWRNYEFAAAEFSPGTNVITGENAQGKTNLLEAVYLLTGGKSFRTRFDKELIGFGYTSAEVLADVFAFGRTEYETLSYVGGGALLRRSFMRLCNPGLCLFGRRE